MLHFPGSSHAVDGRNPSNKLRLLVYLPFIDRVFYIPGGCLGFLPSTIGTHITTMVSSKAPQITTKPRSALVKRFTLTAANSSRLNRWRWGRVLRLFCDAKFGDDVN